MILRAVLGLFLVLMVLEIGLRMGGFVMLSMQEQGNLRAIKQKGEFRILCLGESTTRNQYPIYLEKILDQRNLGVKIRVIDEGVVATNTVTILRQLEANLDKYRPNVVVTMMGCNDWTTMYYQDIPEANTWVFKHCRVYRFGRLLWMQLFKKLKKENIPLESKVALAPEVPRSDQSEPARIEKPPNKTAEVRPENDVAWVQSGRLFSSQGKLAEAEEAFHKALELNPRSDFAYSELGLVYREQMKYHEAELMFKKAIELDPTNDSAYAGLGWAYRDQGKYAESESMLKQALKLNAQNDFAYADLGRLYLAQQRYAQSEEMLKEAIKLNPKAGEAYVVLSMVYRDQGKLDEGEQILKRAVAMNPGYDPAYVGLGQICKIQKRLSEAEKFFKKAMEVNPRSVLAQGGLATVYGETGEGKLSDAYADKLNNQLGQCYNPTTADNYRKFKKILSGKKIKLVCVQYPMRSVQSLKNMFPEGGVIFVDNERIFKEAVKKEGYNEYFRDNFGGNFGHCTVKGNQLLAENIANVILKEVFGEAA